MSNLLAGVLGALLALAQPTAGNAASTPPTPATTAKANTAPDDLVEQEYQKLLAADDSAQEEANRLLTQNAEAQGRGAGLADGEVRRRLRDRFEPVRLGYEDFLKRHPRHAKARVAYGSFLGDLGDEEGSRAQWEKALELDPTNPAIYNNLAGIYTHSGPVTNAFSFYAKAIELNPREPTYYHNFGTAVYLFRLDAKDYFKLDESGVFAKAFALYSNAMRLDPDNFPLASDVAQSYYGISPLRTDEALKAWTNAFKIARNDVEREGVHVHFARLKTMAGRFAEARLHLGSITNEVYSVTKSRLARNLADREAESGKAGK